MAIILKPENVARLVFFVRGERVMLDADLAPLWCDDGQSQQGGEAQSIPIPRRFHVPTQRERDGEFDIPIWKIKRPRRAAASTVRVHRTRRSNVIERAQ